MRLTAAFETKSEDTKSVEDLCGQFNACVEARRALMLNYLGTEAYKSYPLAVPLQLPDNANLVLIKDVALDDDNERDYDFSSSEFDFIARRLKVGLTPVKLVEVSNLNAVLGLPC